MTRLVFPNERVLQLCLTSGLVPAEVQAAPARLARGSDGELLLEPSRPLGREPLKALQRAGVSVADANGGKQREVCCWAEALSPAGVPEAELSTGLVLFALPPDSKPLTLAEELLRLGCDRQELCFLPDGGALIRAQAPPYYTLTRALDRSPGMPRAYLPTPPGQESVWTELGFRHPLGDRVGAPQGALLLIADDGRWQLLPAGRFISLYELLDIQLPGAPPERLPLGGLEQRLQVRLRLLRQARSVVPTLWQLRTEGDADPRRIVDALVQELPEADLGRLLFAVAGDGDNLTILLRARAGRGAPPVLELPGQAYATWLDLAGLFLPCDAILEPPLRRETLRTLLAPNADELTWLEPAGEGGFVPRRLPDAAFVPLEEWVEYVIDSAAEPLAAWLRSATFEPEAFESTGSEWAEGPRPVEPDEKPSRERRRARRGHDTEETEPIDLPLPTAAAEPAPAYHAAPSADPVAAVATRPVSAVEEELARLEREFIESSAPADDPERHGLWLSLARLYGELGQAREAALCWTRALWEAEGADVGRLAAAWAGAEAAALDRPDHRGQALGGAPDLAALIAVADPAPEHVRAVVSRLVATEGESPRGLADVQVWLERHGDRVDVRSLWLGHLSLSRRVGGDALQLARARDRIFARIYKGLSIEHDVPRFLRFCGGGGDAVTVARLTEELSALRERFLATKRKRSPTEAPEELTRSYVLLIFGYGFARLGAVELARDQARQASAWLKPSDPVHGFLLGAYQARIEQAAAGLPAETPLPAELGARLNQLERFVRFKIDRLREASKVLEPQEHMTPFEGFVRQQADPRGEEFAPMRGMADPEALAAAVAAVMQKALAAKIALEERDRLFDGVMDFFPMLPEAVSVPHLRALVDHVDGIAPVRRCMLLQEALMLSGFFGREELVTELVGRLSDLLGELGPEHLPAVSSTLGECLRSLRRVGLLDEGAKLLERASQAASGGGVDGAVARLQLAAGLAGLGQLERAKEAFREAETVRQDPNLLMPARLKLTRAMAVGLSHMPEDYALGGLKKLGDQLPRVTDAMSTNSHFCLSVIEFMECLVLGYASEKLALGDLGRRWLEEDEYLVRRRIHRDLQRSA
jgi:cellulose synthase operon protein C